MGDRQTDKTTRWQITVYAKQYPLFEFMPDKVAEWGWQTEICPETQREHRQGFMRTRVQMRISGIRSLFPGVHIEVARNWPALINYCKKSETAVAGTRIHQVGAKALTMKDALVRLAGFAAAPPIVSNDTNDPLRKPVLIVDEGSQDYLKKDYWHRVNQLLRDDPDTIGLWVNPAFLVAWKNTRQVWIEQAAIDSSATLSITGRVEAHTPGGGIGPTLSNLYQDDDTIFLVDSIAQDEGSIQGQTGEEEQSR